MQVTETLSDGLRRSYAVRVPASEIETRTKARLADIGKTLRLPGFRPGKVPPNLLRQRFGSSVMAEVLQEAVDGAAELVISERQLRPASQPRVSLDGQPPAVSAPAQDLDIKVELELLPDITLPDLAALSLVRRRAEPTEDVVANALENIAAQNRAFIDVDEERGAATGEILVVDFVGSIDGVEFPGGAATDAPIEVGGSGFIPGFTEQLEGMKAGEQRNIDVTFPEQYQAAELAGKLAQFNVAAKKLQRAESAALDDALATKLGFADFAALREAVVAQIQAQYDQMARLRVKRDLLDLLAETAAFESPASLLDAEFNAIWERVATDRREGRVDDEDKDKDESTLREEYRAIADRRVRLGLLLAEIGRVNNIEVTQAELTTALRNEAGRYPGQEMQVFDYFRKTPGAIEQLRGPLFEDKVVDHILAAAQVTDELVGPDDLAMPGLEEAPKLADMSEPAGDAVSAEPAGATAPAEPAAEPVHAATD